MSTGQEHALELSDVLDQLRLELNVLRRKATDEELQFKLDSVEVELCVGVSQGVEGTAKAKFWVFEMGGAGRQATEARQIIRLKMTPQIPESKEGEVLVSRRG